MSLQHTVRFGDALALLFLHSNKQSWPDLFYKMSLLRV